MRRPLALRALLAALLAAALPACGADRPGEPGPPATETAACDELAAAVQRLDGARTEQTIDSFPAFIGSGMRYGCVVRVAGTSPPDHPVPVVATTLPDSLGPAWQRDDALVADGPAQTVYGLWRGDVLCLVRVTWRPGADPSGPPPAPTAYEASIGCEPLPGRQVPGA